MATKPRKAASDSQRIALWRDAMIEDLGADMRHCIEWIHDETREGLTTVLAALRRICCPQTALVGIQLYWDQLTARKRETRLAAARGTGVKP